MKLNVEEGVLKIILSPLEKLLAVRGSLRVSLDQVAEVAITPPATSWLDLRAPGSFVPWLIKAGTYWTRRGREFWYVTGWSKGFLTIELKRGFYRRLVLGLDDSATWAETLRKRVMG